MKRPGIAAQVYSVREAAERDFAGTMAALRECGYEGVELAGLYGLCPEEVRDCLKGQGLEAVSAHVPYDAFVRDMEGTIGAYRTIGCGYIGIPYLPKERHCGGGLYQETCDFLRGISRRCAAQGMVLLYHNHTFEFERTDQGIFLFDELFGALSPEELQVELDVCWAKVGGVEPVAYLEKYRNRCPVVHMKDFRRAEDAVELAALGEGGQDIPAIARAAAECGAAWLVVEQDDHPHGIPMENMRISCQCLREVWQEKGK